MKLWVLFNTRFEYDAWGHGLEDVVGACFDEEEARNVAARINAQYWREHVDEFVEAHRYELEAWGIDAPVVKDGAITLDDELLHQMCESNSTLRVQLREVELDAVLDTSGLDVVERRRALEGLAALLRPFNPGAAAVLEGEVKR